MVSNGVSISNRNKYLRDIADGHVARDNLSIATCSVFLKILLADCNEISDEELVLRPAIIFFV
jgi:hypothetical protein